MNTAQTPNVWVPVCCERVMRYNMFVPRDGEAYGALVCTVCNKNITLELEPAPDLSAYGDGSRVLHLLGTPKPPKSDRRRTSGEAYSSDKTL